LGSKKTGGDDQTDHRLLHFIRYLNRHYSSQQGISQQGWSSQQLWLAAVSQQSCGTQQESDPVPTKANAIPAERRIAALKAKTLFFMMLKLLFE
jgi:hypothetical protein